MSLLKIITAPDPVLRSKAISVDSVDDSVRKLMDDMLETMYHDRGVGLAANQVGVLKRVFVIDLQDNDEEINRPENFYPLFIANPEIIKSSKEMVDAEEGCLSLPTLRSLVARHESLVLKYLDYNNKEQKMEINGWLARAVQHEIDHLNGILAIDHLSKLKQDVAMRKLKKMKKLSD